MLCGWNQPCFAVTFLAPGSMPQVRLPAARQQHARPAAQLALRPAGNPPGECQLPQAQ